MSPPSDEFIIADETILLFTTVFMIFPTPFLVILENCLAAAGVNFNCTLYVGDAFKVGCSIFVDGDVIKRADLQHQHSSGAASDHMRSLARFLAS